MEQDVCSVCSASGERIVLAKCLTCHKVACEACGFQRGGRTFCSRRCADHYFSDDEDD